MAGFKVEKQTAGAVVLDDLGITLTGAIGTVVDLTDLAPENIARSADMLAAIPADILVVDPRDDSDTTILSSADSTLAVQKSNDTHFGISGGRFGGLDDPTVTPGTDFIIQYNSGGDNAEFIDPDDFMSNQSDSIGTIVGGMGSNGSDTTFVYDGSASPLIGGQDETNYDASTNNGTFVGGDGVGGTAYVALDTITLSDGSVITVDAVDGNGDVTAYTVTTPSGANVTAGVPLTQTGTSGTGAAFTMTPETNNISQGTLQWDVDDSFLRNTGDTLDSGTLTIASGATLDLPTGATITIAGDVTEASIQTPGGGFVNDDDIINKLYVDSIAGGFDYKESVRVGSTPADGDITAGSFGGTYATSPSNGQFTGVDLSVGTGAPLDGLNFTGVVGTGLIIGDRVLIKDQTDATENGIYVISAGSVATSVTLTRSEDFDGSPAAEVSGGATTFIDDTTAINPTSVNANTRWSVIGEGILTLNTDDIDWTQTGGVGVVQAGIGLSSSGAVIDLDVDDLTTATVVAGDIIAFHDLDGSAESSGSQTRKATFQSVFNSLDVPNNITSDGFVVRIADDSYASRSITVNGAGPLDGLAVSNGDGVSADPVIGLDIQNLPVRGATDTNDLVAVFDGVNNVYYTVGDIAGAASASNSFETWTPAGNSAGGSLVADSATDTVTLSGGDGIFLTTVPGSDLITFAFSRAGLANTAVVAADTVPFFDASNSDEPEYRSFADIITDLGLLDATAGIFQTIAGDTGSAVADNSTDTLNLIGATNGGITTIASDGPENVTFSITPVDLATGAATLELTDFIIVSDSADTAATVAQKYTFGDVVTDLGLLTAVTASALEDLTGIDVTGGSVIGLDILGLTAAGDEMAATDEFPLHDKSEGTAGANGKITGQDVADGTATILGIGGLTFDTFPAVTSPADDQTLLAFTDGTRGDKVLSVESHTFQWSDNKIKDNDWLRIGQASDADSGWVMPLDATIVGVTAHTENTGGGNTFDIDLYLDGVDSGALATLTGGADVSDTDPTLNIDVDAGEKIRLRADQTAGGGDMQDTTVAVLVKWRS